MTEELDALRTSLADRYHVIRLVGAGGAARVYLATEARTERRVAVKVLRSEVGSTVGTERFLREINVVSHLTHPNILPLEASGRVLGRPYYVAPFVDAGSLRDRLQRERHLVLDEALSIARDVAAGLDYAHGEGFVHRDIKPENILLTNDHAAIADFGIVRAIGPSEFETLTETGLRLGTPHYMSPEQGGSGVVDGRADQYSLACVVHEMLAGEPPFDGPDDQSIIRKHVLERPPSTRVTRPGVPYGTSAALLRGLEKVAADRYGSVTEFVGALSDGRRVVAPPRHVNRWVRNGFFTAALVLIGFLMLKLLGPAATLDPRSVVVFPMDVTALPADVQPGATDVAAALWAAFNSTDYVRAIDGRRLLMDTGQSALVPPREAAALARGVNARYVVTGTLVSATPARLILELRDLAADTAAHHTVESPTADDPWTLGYQGAVELLPALIPSGELAGLTAIGRRSPAALASFLRGERAYRQARFSEAQRHYADAVALDSSFSRAALKGAQAASWNLDRQSALTFVTVALSRADSLSPRHHAFAEGMYAYLHGAADDAVAAYERALARDSNWAEAWMGLGEVYTHLLPRRTDVPARAAEAFTTVLQLDSGFAPARYHLVERLLRNGDVAGARDMLRRFRAAQPDAREVTQLALMLACVTGADTEASWREAVLVSPATVLDVARSLAAGGSVPRCAEKAWRAVLQFDTATSRRFTNRWSATLGLQSLLLAQGRLDETRALLDSGSTEGLPTSYLYLIDAVAEPAMRHDAIQAAEAIRADPRSEENSTALWLLGSFALASGDTATAMRYAGILKGRGAGGSANDSILGFLLHRLLELRRPGSVGALGTVDDILVPHTRDIQWSLWAARGAVRLALAEALSREGRHAEAIMVASNFDSPQPVLYVAFIGRSLRLRLALAEQLGDRRLVRWYRDRLERLRPLDR